MANSSDWLTALLERPLDEPGEPQKLSWLPDFGLKDDGFDNGFVAGMPFEKNETPKSLPSSPPKSPQIPAVDPPSSPDELSKADTREALEDILVKALADSEKGQSTPQVLHPQSDPLPNSGEDYEPGEPDPIAEAFAQGEAAGRLAAQAEFQELADQKLRLRHTLRTLDQSAMDALAEDLAQTVITLCSQSIADFVPAPEALRGRCNEAAKRIGNAAGAGAITLHLHPDDLVLIDQERLAEWRIIGDLGVERGGLRLETDDGTISDTPADWRKAIAIAIGG